MKDLIKEQNKFLEERGWLSKVPADVAKSISIEAAEILEHFQWSNPSVEEIKADSGKFEELKKEIADVFIYLLQMADMLGLDPETIVREKLEYVKKKYPVEAIKGPDHRAYFKLKKAHRQENA